MIGTKIIQILPAENWWSVCSNEENEDVGVERLVCWALVSHKATGESVEEMLAEPGFFSIDFVAEITSFLGYVYAESEEDALQEAKAIFL